jgi:hypothetical protein
MSGLLVPRWNSPGFRACSVENQKGDLLTCGMKESWVWLQVWLDPGSQTMSWDLCFSSQLSSTFL